MILQSFTDSFTEAFTSDGETFSHFSERLIITNCKCTDVSLKKALTIPEQLCSLHCKRLFTFPANVMC